MTLVHPALTIPAYSFRYFINPAFIRLAAAILVWVYGHNPAVGQTRTVPKWSVHEIVLTAQTSYADAYREASVQATITGPGGIEKEINGFWDGEKRFVVRFTPTVEGTWKYTTHSADAGLNRKSGSITCTANRPGTHGFLRRDEQYRYHFKYDDGTRYFMFGQTYYGLLSYAKSGGNWRTSIDSTLIQGMNKVRMHINGGLSEASTPEFVSTGMSDSGNALNLAHFRKADEVIGYMNDRGMIADLIVFPRKILGTQQDEERYLRYIIARYAAYPNVIWCLINEWNYSTRPKEFWNIMGRLTKKEDPWAVEGKTVRLLSVHQRTRIDFEFFGQPWLSHAIIQYGVRNKQQTDNDSEWIKTGKTKYRNGDEWGNASIVYNLGHNIPVVNDEYGYIGEHRDVSVGGKDTVAMTREKHRQIMWGIYAAGGYAAAGDKYLYPDGGRPYMTGKWQNPEEYTDIRNLVDFFTKKKFAYWQMKSHNAFVKSGNRTYVLAQPGKQYIIYAATGGTFSIDLPEGTYEAGRFNPATGEDTPLKAVKGGKTTSFSLPDTQDWVVYLRTTG